MITVLFVAIPLEHKGNRKLLACRSLAAFARYVGYPEMVNQGDSSKHALMAVAHGACAPLTCAAQRRSPVKSKASNGAAERDRAVQTAEGMPRTLRLDVPSRNNVAVGSILTIMSFLERDAAWLLSQAGSADSTTAHSRQLEKSHDSPLPPFAGTGHVKGSDTLGFQAEEQPGIRFVAGEMTDDQRSPHWHESGHGCGSHHSTLSSTPVAGRPANVATGNETGVTRHAEVGKTDRVLPATPRAPVHGGSGVHVGAPPGGDTTYQPTALDNTAPARVAVNTLRSELEETRFPWTWQDLWIQGGRHLLQWRSMRTASRQNPQR